MDYAGIYQNIPKCESLHTLSPKQQRQIYINIAVYRLYRLFGLFKITSIFLLSWLKKIVKYFFEKKKTLKRFVSHILNAI